MRRRGQSAIETMMVVPLVAVTILALYYLWSVIFASENAHIRARESVLHGSAYLADDGGVSGSSPFAGNNYKRADDTDFHFESSARDESLGVFGAAEPIEAKAIIKSK